MLREGVGGAFAVFVAAHLAGINQNQLLLEINLLPRDQGGIAGAKTRIQHDLSLIHI